MPSRSTSGRSKSSTKSSSKSSKSYDRHSSRRSRAASSSSDFSSSLSESSEDEEREIGRKSKGRSRMKTMLAPGKSYAPVAGNVAPEGATSDSDTGAPPPAVSSSSRTATPAPPPPPSVSQPVTQKKPGCSLCLKMFIAVLVVLTLAVIAALVYFFVIKKDSVSDLIPSLEGNSSSSVPALNDSLPASTSISNSSSSSSSTNSSSDVWGNLTPGTTTPGGSSTTPESWPSSGSASWNGGSLTTPGSGTPATTPTGKVATQPGGTMISGQQQQGTTPGSAPAGAPTAVLTSSDTITSAKIFGSNVRVSGKATWVEAVTVDGSCGNDATDADYIVHLSKVLWGTPVMNNPLCGKKVTVWNPINNKTKAGIVSDYCKTCGAADIDLSKAMFSIVGGDPATGVVDVQWWSTDEGSGSVPSAEAPGPVVVSSVQDQS